MYGTGIDSTAVPFDIVIALGSTKRCHNGRRPAGGSVRVGEREVRRDARLVPPFGACRCSIERVFASKSFWQSIRLLW